MSNPSYNLKECKDCNEFWDILSPENPLGKFPDKFIYRGQRNATWGLLPTALRENTGIAQYLSFVRNNKEVEVQIFKEIQVLKWFVDACDQSGLSIPNDSPAFRSKHLDLNNISIPHRFMTPSYWPSDDYFELMALAQHHEVPTRLLDWTARSYVAAYFAAADVLSAGDFDGKLAVWALNTELINLFPNIKIVSVPKSNNSNMAAQAGSFTLLKQGGYRGDLFVPRGLEEEFVKESNPPLWKITIPNKYAKDVLIKCKLYGITAATLFPNYFGAAKYVNDTFNYHQSQ
jgi:FRG domain